MAIEEYFCNQNRIHEPINTKTFSIAKIHILATCVTVMLYLRPTVIVWATEAVVLLAVNLYKAVH